MALGLLNAALAAGWGASWLTGWAAYDRALVEGELGLAPEEWIAGLRLYRQLRGAAAGPAAAGRGGAHHLGRGVSLLVDLGRALAQLGDPRFLRVLLRALVLTVAGAGGGVLGGGARRSAGSCPTRVTLPWIGQVGFLDEPGRPGRRSG